MIKKLIINAITGSAALILGSTSIAGDLSLGSERFPPRHWGAEEISQLPDVVSPDLATGKSYKVGVRTINITNVDQVDIDNPTKRIDRAMKVEVWYPSSGRSRGKQAVYNNVTRLKNAFSLSGEAYRNRPPHKGEKYPLVVISHGYTGYRTIMYYLGEHLAANGYIVAAIDHPDSTNEAVDFVNAPFSGFRSTLFNRPRDQQFILDYFASENNFLADVVDTDNAAIIGYSMGGYGAVNLVGGCFNYTQARLQSFGFTQQQADTLLPLFNRCAGNEEDGSYVDSRWKGMIAFAPWGGQLGIFNASDLNNINVPSLFIAGDEDQISGYEFGVKGIYEAVGAADKYMLVYENSRHNIAPHSAPKIARNTVEEYGHYNDEAWNNEVLNAVNKHFSLAFLNCHVKQVNAACEFLDLRRNSNTPAGSVPWKGFSSQYSTGMQWHTPGN